MTVKVAINGFGRIGRLVARALFEDGGATLPLGGFDERLLHGGGVQARGTVLFGNG